MGPPHDCAYSINAHHRGHASANIPKCSVIALMSHRALERRYGCLP